MNDVAVAKSDTFHSEGTQSFMRIGDWQFDRGTATITNIKGEQKRLSPKTLKVLLILVENAGITVSRKELLDRVWKSTYPSDYVVSRAIADLRSAFGEEAKSAAYIQTIPKLGYRLIADISYRQASEQPKESLSPENSKRPSWLVIAVTVIFFLTLALTLVFTIARPPSTDNIAIPLPIPITTELGLEHMARVSSDAKWVIFASLEPNKKDWDIYSQSIEEAVPRPVAVSEAVEFGPALSPQNDEVAYVRFSTEGCKIAVQGLYQSEPQLLASCTTKFLTVVDWSPNGRDIAFTSDNQSANKLRAINLVDRFTGNITPLSKGVSTDGTDYYPRFSPNGYNLAFLRGEPKPEHHAKIFVVDIESKHQREITTDGSFLAGLTWLDDERLLYVQREGGQLITKTVNITTGASSELALRDVFQPDYNIKNKTLSMSKLRKDIDITLLNVTEKSTEFIAESTASEWGADLSPDGRWLTFISTRTGNNQLWIVSVASGAIRQLSQFENADISAPHWNVDSETILFNVKQGEQRQLFTINIITGDTQALDTGNEAASSGRWLSNGHDIIYSCQRQGTWKLCQQNVHSRKSTVIFDHKAFDPVIDQNDRVFFTKETAGLWLLDSKTGKAKNLWPDLPQTLGAAWTIENNTVFYVRPSNQLGKAQIEARNLATGETQVIHRGPIQSFNSSLNSSRDGSVLVFSSQRSAQDDVVLFQPVNLFESDQ